jgi:hypothetical protein
MYILFYFISVAHCQFCGYGWMIRVSKPDNGKGFFSSPNRLDCLWGPTSHLFNVNRCFFRGLTWPGREMTTHPPSGAEVKNDFSYTSTLPIRLDGLDRGNCTFSPLILLSRNRSRPASDNLSTLLVFERCK